MKSPLFKDNVEDKEIRFKNPGDIDVVENKEVKTGMWTGITGVI